MSNSEYFCEEISQEASQNLIRDKCNQYKSDGWSLVNHSIASDERHFLTFERFKKEEIAG
tara:strand:- start:537 stop:716 length:180 start_codon:yes stop_codon:yes gene_type:complete